MPQVSSRREVIADKLAAPIIHADLIRTIAAKAISRGKLSYLIDIGTVHIGSTGTPAYYTYHGTFAGTPQVVLSVIGSIWWGSVSDLSPHFQVQSRVSGSFLAMATPGIVDAQYIAIGSA